MRGTPRILFRQGNNSIETRRLKVPSSLIECCGYGNAAVRSSQAGRAIAARLGDEADHRVPSKVGVCADAAMTDYTALRAAVQMIESAAKSGFFRTSDEIRPSAMRNLRKLAGNTDRPCRATRWIIKSAGEPKSVIGPTKILPRVRGSPEHRRNSPNCQLAFGYLAGGASAIGA